MGSGFIDIFTLLFLRFFKNKIAFFTDAIFYVLMLCCMLLIILILNKMTSKTSVVFFKFIRSRIQHF